MASKALQPRDSNNVDPAGLPLSEKEDRQVEAIVDLLAKGMRPPEIARKVHPKDKIARKNLRRKLWRQVREDAYLMQRVAARAQGELAINLIPAARALGKRASITGKAPETKLLMEATGFHTPKQDHRHSGEIKIKVDMPRPQAVNVPEEDIQDADVEE